MQLVNMTVTTVVRLICLNVAVESNDGNRNDTERRMTSG